MPLTVETAGYQLGLIGLGQMAQALLQPLLEQKLFTAQQVVGCVATTASAQKLEQRYGIQVGINPDPCLAAPLQLLAIKPQQLAAFLQHPAQLKDMVSSPGGTTIAGLRELERAGLRSALMEAVFKAAERSRELG